MRFLIRFFRVYMIRSLNIYENICSEIFFRIRSRRHGAGRLLQCLFFPTPPRRKVLYSTVFFLPLYELNVSSETTIEMQRSLIETGRALNFCSAGLLFFRDYSVFLPKCGYPLTAMKCELVTVVADHWHSTLKSDTFVASQQSGCGYRSSEVLYLVAQSILQY